jgi:hypothetical protein
VSKPADTRKPKPVLVVPDSHLRIERMRSVLDEWGDKGPVVFLGDFFDDFDDTPKRNQEMACYLKETVLHNANHTVLMGNHDLHYHPRCPSELWCSGFHPDKKKAIGEVLGLEDFERFKWAHEWGGVLFTHAGLHPRLTPAMAKGEARELAGWIEKTCSAALDNLDPSEPLLRAGRMRGGYQPFGGVIWMDAREYQPVGTVRQIFGHTPLRKALPLDSTPHGSWCVDTNLETVAILKSGGEALIVADATRDIGAEFSQILGNTAVLEKGSGAGRGEAGAKKAQIAL